MLRSFTLCLLGAQPLLAQGTWNKVPLDDAALLAQDIWDKVLLTDAAKNAGAVCLDGSPGGYYIRRKKDPTKWIIFHQGGGWCVSNQNCGDRANGTLGSSKHWGPTYNDFYEGSQLFATPPFDDYTVVYAMYCDGGSWTGDLTESVQSGGIVPTIYYRGRRLLEAMFDELFAVEGLGKATELLYGGCSAGALTAYINADYAAARMQQAGSSATVSALGDAMFVLEVTAFDGQPSYQTSQFGWGYSQWNSSAAVNQKCLAAQSAGHGYKCMVGATAAAFTETPTFVLQSKYDSWQNNGAVGVGCPQGNINECPPAEEAFWVQYGREMVAALDALPAQHGSFVYNCPSHCQSGTTNWAQASVNGTHMGSAVVEWYAARVKGEHVARNVARCNVKPCGADTC